MVNIREVSPFSLELANSVERYVRLAGKAVSTHLVDASQDLEQQTSSLAGAGLAGIIVLGTELRQIEWPAYARLGIPTVVLDAFLPSIDVDCVTINNHQGAYLATNALLSEGRGCPGHLTSAIRIQNFEERRNGFHTAIHEAGYSSARVHSHAIASMVEDAEQDMGRIIDSGAPLARCYFADFAQIAIGAVRALLSRGIRVPEDVSVIGFDDIDIARYCQPALTTMHVDRAYLARTAVDRLLQIMEQDGHRPLRLEVGTALVRRGTTL